MSKQVDFHKAEYELHLPRWELVDDCDNGQQAVKAKGDIYLRKPNKADNSSENQARFKEYLKGAIFSNYTQKTTTGLVGEIFKKAPVKELPTEFDPIIEDIDGAGVSLEQQAKETVRRVLKFARAGLLTDHPTVEGQISRADQQSGRIRPTITSFDARNIINWRVERVGSESKLTLIVIEYQKAFVDPEDEFSETLETQWLQLELINGVYSQTIWERDDDSTKTEKSFRIVDGPNFPRKGNGNLWDEIPFTFVGSSNNDETIDLAAIYDLAVLNIGHYRNSADWEESSFQVGQPTLSISGLTQQWVTDLYPDGFTFGSRASLMLPEGASAQLLQAAPNSMPFEGMQHKERQMVAIGARIVQETGVARTATEAGFERTSETSQLSQVAQNVSSAYQKALNWAWQFLDRSGSTNSDIKYQLNDDFEIAKLDPQVLQGVIAAWMSGAISQEEMRTKLAKMNLASEDFEEFVDNVGDKPPGLPTPEPQNQGGLNNGA
jgi:hypothetical protein